MKDKKQLKSLKLNLLTAKKHHVKDLEYIYIDNNQNVIASNGFSAIKTTLTEAMGTDVAGFSEILSQYKKIYIHADEFKKIANKEIYGVDIVAINGNDLFLRFMEGKKMLFCSDITIKANIRKFDFFEKCLEDDFFAVNNNAIESIAIDFDLLNNFNDAIKSRIYKGANGATVFNFSSKFDKILVKNISLKNTMFVLLPVKIHHDNY